MQHTIGLVAECTGSRATPAEDENLDDAMSVDDFRHELYTANDRLSIYRVWSGESPNNVVGLDVYFDLSVRPIHIELHQLTRRYMQLVLVYTQLGLSCDHLPEVS